MDIENINENEESEREELESESIRVPINNAETNQYDKVAFHFFIHKNFFQDNFSQRYESLF